MTPDAQHPQRCTASATFIRQSDCGDRSLLPSKQVCGDCHYLTHSSTPAPAGYIITEEELVTVDIFLSSQSPEYPERVADELIAAIRSHPTPATAGCPRWRDGECKATWGLVEEEAASEAREQVLEEALQAVDQIAVIYGIDDQLRTHLSESIESLRQHKGGTSE